MCVCCSLVRHQLNYDEPKLLFATTSGAMLLSTVLLLMCIDTTAFCLDKVCFGKRSYLVDEGENIQVYLTLSTTLQYPLTVQLEYTDMQTKISKLISV